MPHCVLHKASAPGPHHAHIAHAAARERTSLALVDRLAMAACIVGSGSGAAFVLSRLCCL